MTPTEDMFEEQGTRIIKAKNTVKDYLGEAALYEQMAEECTELAQALLKKSRKLRGNNPTPLTMGEINAHVKEEYTDVSMCAELLDIDVNFDVYNAKLFRWEKRIEFDKALKEKENINY